MNIPLPTNPSVIRTSVLSNEERRQQAKENQGIRKRKVHNHTHITVCQRNCRLIRIHNIHTLVKPYRKLRQILAHSKDKIEPDQKRNIIYEIPCRSCNKTYIGERGRAFSTHTKKMNIGWNVKKKRQGCAQEQQNKRLNKNNSKPPFWIISEKTL